MADPPRPSSPGPSSQASFPSGIAASQPINHDKFHPEPVVKGGSASTSAGGDQAAAAAGKAKADNGTEGPSDFDYTENAPQAIVDAIAIERAREEKEGPADMMVGSFSSWAGSLDDPGIFPKAATRAPGRPGSRRASIASRHSTSYRRPSIAYNRQYSSQDVLHSPSSGVFVADSDNEDIPPAMQALPPARLSGSYSGQVISPNPRRRESRRRGRASVSQEDYFGGASSSRGRRSGRDGEDEGEEDYDEHDRDEVSTSPTRPSTTFGKLASYIGFNRHEADDEEAGLVHRRGSHSRAHSRAPSFDSAGSGRRSASRSSSGWGLSDDEDEDEYSDRAEGEEGYTSSLADDTSLPPQSRPGSPTLPLIPIGGDAIFGDHGGRHDGEEAKDFASISVPSRQTILLPDEDLSIRFTCYRTDPFRRILWWLGCILSLGALGLLGRWVPSVWVKFCGRETAFDEAREGAWLVVETPYGDLHVIPLQIIPYPYPLSTVFPHVIVPTAENSRAGSVRDNAHSGGSNGVAIQPPLHALPDQPPGGVGAAKDLIPDVEPGKTTWEETMGFLKIMDYRYTRFALEPGTGRWAMIRDWRDPKWSSARTVAHGLDSGTREQRRVLMGDNIIDIASKSLGGLLVDEVLHPFYVFQIASIVLWSIDDYYYYAFAIALISITSILSTLIETKRTIERMREMSRFNCDVQVLIDGEWQVRDCQDLVPGDIFDASDSTLTVMPCDAILLAGDAIVNESMLTGESVPVSKIPIKDESLRVMSRESKQGSSEVDSDLAKHYLFSGTRIIRVRAGARPPWAPKSEEPIALAMVTRTGFNTTKGALVRSMLFPKPMGFKFYRDSMNFIGVLAMIAGLGFAVSAVQFVRMGIHWHTILLRALDLITIVVPPALPATLTIGTTFAIERLRRKGIFCISPNRVNIGGKINVICFDKTGTLTEDGLDVLGVRTIDRQDSRFSELHSDVTEVPTTGGLHGKTPLLYALATCHALKLIDGEVIGDPLDIKMFEYTGWTLDEGQSRAVTAKGSAAAPTGAAERPQALVQTVVRPPGTERWKMEDAMKSGSKHAHFLELGVIRTFEFVSALRRMSVVVKRLKSSSMEIYVKGAPEVMQDICDPASFPMDYEDMLSYYTRNGFRVIAIAGKSVEGLTWLKAQRLRREQAESDLQFLGFIVFENKLKAGTTPAIHTLRAAHLACRMVTGDNVRTAISVARECGLVSHSASVYIPTFMHGTGSGESARLDWSSVDDEHEKLDEWTLKPVVTQTDGFAADAGEMEMHDYQLALTGDVFKWMLDYAEIETMERMLVKGVIFARMSPDEKAELVERLQGLGYTVAFCGDGANDCGALKAADVGVSLSEAEASVAAPFTSRISDISCMVEVIKEGRAALVTSFSCFKYMALYSMIQFTTVTLLYSFASSLGDFQFLYIDLFVIIPIAVAMGRTLPYPKIHPKRPTASLVSKKVLTSIIGQILLNSAFQVVVFVWVRQQSWYTEPDVNDDKLETFNYENTALFLISCFQYILVAGVFSVGPPYRKPIYSNVWLVLCLVGLGGFSTYVLLSPAQTIADFLDIISLPTSFKLELLLVAVLNIALCMGFERYAERPIARMIAQTKKAIRRRRGRKYNVEHQYKIIEGNMR